MLPAAALEAGSMRRATLRRVTGDVDTLRDLVRTDHAVVLTLELWPAFFAAHGGALGVPAPSDLMGALHAVAIVGFDDATQALLLRNSWGKTWGDAGHGRLPYSALKVACRGAWVVDDDVDA
jgi:hypothetical protein